MTKICKKVLLNCFAVKKIEREKPQRISTRASLMGGIQQHEVY